MTYRITWEPEATNTAVRVLKDDPTGLAAVHEADPTGLAAVREAVDTLTEAPRPGNSTPYGPQIRRLRVGDCRILYLIDDEVVRILVMNLGRTP
ncbi:type II toxin-antitoxin system RelE/ParE family toxin [Streptomyces fagopyri]|uniref:Type II toxin-antitoxin system RelE/ParE family toxin n=1 Tax=Streptomyces fagopyri TaxID=2662397 RepID=A0A5Q0LFR7_9ACTN|nr:type II toxin-antitoxin system RelE/ParE family toxin [Streptomyces fagopyri]QFZ75880.1 type II toxin-antitoxin system RelE/ParE family toxin [Streptomyces fagopyri]